MIKKYLVPSVAIYKIITNLFRLILGIIIFSFKGDLSQLLSSLFSKELTEDANDFLFNFISVHLNIPSTKLVLLLAFILVLFSSLEIIFAVTLFFRQRIGAIGLFVISLLWIPFEILFISKFLIFHKITTLILDIIVLVILFKIIKQFQKQKVKKLK